MTERRAASLALFSTLFFLSGAAGLVYEVCWTRLLRLPLGNTLHSMTAVLTAFMAGLALGAWLAGRFIDARRVHPLRAYAVLEAAIGVACFAVPWVTEALEPLLRAAYRQADTAPGAFHALRFVACALVILVPATLMGATLPVLCRHFVDRTGRLGATIGWLYAVNALGAAAGSLLAGFVLIPLLGLRHAMWAGVATSLAVAALAWFGQRAAAAAPFSIQRVPAVAPVESSGRFARHSILAGYALSGVAAMVLQIAWARALALLLGSSVYAFALVVGAFILGLAAGSAAIARVADRIRRPALGFALAEIGIGLAALAIVPVLQRYPEWMLQLVPRVAQDFGRFQLVQFGLVFATLLLPTACMGACLPLVGRALARGIDRAGATVGTAYSLNAVGTIAGAALGGFVLLPVLGMHRAILAAAGLNLAAGAVVLAAVLGVRPARAALAACVVLGAGAVAMRLVPPFDAATITSGMYLYADRMAREMEPGADLRSRMQDEYAILLHREGPNVTVTVRETTAGQRILALNGKSDASDGGDMPTQQLLGHLPCLLHPEPRDVAVVGLASGVTLRSVAAHPAVRAIDCIEIAPEIVEATRLFAHVNGGVLDDPRLRLVFQDARNHMTLSGREYDVIVSEPSNPWIAGIANLFTREFVQACHDRLRPGGTFCQWVQVYGLDLHALRSVARTFQDVFPEATLWEAEFAADFLLVGRKPGGDAPPMTADELARRMAHPAVAADLARMNVQGVADLLARNVTDAAGLLRFASAGEIYRDDRNRLEFAAPRLMHRVTEMTTLETIQALREPGWPRWLATPSSGTTADDLARAAEAQRTFFAGVVARSRGDLDGAVSRFLAALELHPRSQPVWPHLLDATREWAPRALARGDTATVLDHYDRMLGFEPQLVEFYTDAALLRAATGDRTGALRDFERALALRPRNVFARFNLAVARMREGDPAGAEAEFRQVLTQRPEHLRARLALGSLHLQRGDAKSAENEFRAAITAHPDAAQPWFLLGEALLRHGAREDAADAYDAALERDPAHQPAAAARRRLGEAG